MTILIFLGLTIIGIMGYHYNDIGSPFVLSFKFVYLILLGVILIYYKRYYKSGTFGWSVMMIYVVANIINSL